MHTTQQGSLWTRVRQGLRRSVVPFGALAAVIGVTAPLPAEPAAEATSSGGLRLMSQGQYVNTIARVFGEDIRLRIRFAPVKRVDGLLAVGASRAVLTSGALDPLDASARTIADQVTDRAHRDVLVPCRPVDLTAPDAVCARAFFAQAGRLLFRRPVNDAELDRYVAMAGSAAATRRDFYAGLSSALSGMLVSPQFLFIRERYEPDIAHPGMLRLDGYSRAARLSFALWNSAPDAALLNAAEAGRLHNPAGLAREVDRMLASPLHREGVREFFNDFFALEAFDTLAKDPTIYPAFSLKAVTEAREQILRTVVDHLVTRQGDYRDLFTTRKTQMSAELAMLYKVPVNTGSLGWVPYEFGENDGRSGILTQVGFLAQYAHAGRSSPTRRGRGIRETLLCQRVPDPPPNVDFSNFENPRSALKTARARLSLHQENPVCAGCHRITDPIGLGLENFDGAGQFRANENGSPIDASGTLDGKKFSDSKGLGLAVRDNPALRSCVVNRLFAFANGRQVVPADEPRLGQYVTALDKRGYRFDDMVRMIVLDPQFFALRPLSVAMNTPRAGG